MSLFYSAGLGTAIPDGVVDNFEESDSDPPGPYGSGDDISTYYTTISGTWARTTTAIKNAQSVERATASGSADSDAIISTPGDGLPTYPSDGETVSGLIRTGSGVTPGLLAGVNTSLEGYSVLLVNGSSTLLSRFDGAGSRTDLDTGPDPGAGDFEVVINPPASGESSISASVYSLDGSLNRDTQIASLSASSESTYAGQRGVGVVAQSGSGTGTLADEIRVGRSL